MNDLKKRIADELKTMIIKIKKTSILIRRNYGKKNNINREQNITI